MHKPILQRGRQDGVTNLYFKGRLWKRFDDNGHLAWWYEVCFESFQRKMHEVNDAESRILERLYRRNRHHAVKRIRREGPLKAIKFKQLKNGRIKLWTHDGGLYLGKPSESDNKGHCPDEYEFFEVVGAHCEVEDVDETLRMELNKICQEHLEESSESSESEVHRRGGEKQEPGEKSRESGIKRTKFGVQIYSNDKKHFFGIGVWKSKKYPGHTTVRLYTAGRPLIYTLDKANMKAFREEVSLGEPT